MFRCPVKPICSHAFRLPLLAAALFLAPLLTRQTACAQTFDLVSLAGTSWRFDDTAQDLGTAWRDVNYPAESGWRTGTAMFGVEPTLPYPYPSSVSTPLILGANRITYYFRTRFTLAQNPSGVVVQGTAYVDDGAVFYLNGQEVGRVRVPDQPVLYTSRAQLANPEGLAYSWTIPSGALIQGENVLAVEVHQNSSSSSDVLFGLRVQATVVIPPSIVNPSEPADRIVPQGQPTTLMVFGQGTPSPAYQWYKNGAPVPGATAASLHFPTFMATDAGQYYAVLSNVAGMATSRVAQVQFLADTNPPSILYAIGRSSTTFEVVFSEPIKSELLDDLPNWFVRSAGGAALNIALAEVHSLTNVTYTTSEERNPAVEYVFGLNFDIFDLNDNILPAGTSIPVASFPATLLTLSDPIWRYHDTGANPGAGWAATGFDDSSWNNGQCVFDAFRAESTSTTFCRPLVAGTLEPVGTCFAISNLQNSAQLSAAYFRTHFQFPGNPTNSVLRFRVLVDDGAVVYLNGVEVFRTGMAAGPVTHTTLANRTVPNPVWETFELASSALVAGDNVLAVELHQESLQSPDFTFGLDLNATLPSAPVQQRADAAPRLNAAANEGLLNVSWLPASGRLQAANASQGPWMDVAAVEPGRYFEPMTAAQKFFRVVTP